MKIVSIFFFSFLCFFAVAQGDKLSGRMKGSFPKDFSTLPIKPERTILFTTDEASYIDLDISPDGKTLVCSFLGELFTIPATGGNARQLTRGGAINYSPAWSLNGKYIAYGSYATGMGRLHVMDTSGTFHKELSDGKISQGARVIWLSNSKEISIGYTTTYHATGVRAGAKSDISQIVKFSTDSNYLYFIGKVEGSDKLIKYNRNTRDKITVFDFNKELNGTEISSIRMSPNNKWLCYIKYNDNKGSQSLDSLWGIDLDNGKQKLLAPFHIQSVSPIAQNACFSNDSKDIYIGYGGKIHRINTESGDNMIIPFVAGVEIDMGSLNYNTSRVSIDPFQVKYIGSINRSPSSKHIVFSALNRIYIKDLPNGVPRVLVEQNTGQFQPSYSPDGKWITYITWKEKEEGHVWKIHSNGGEPEQLTNVAGTYLNPSWSPDGRTIVLTKACDKIGANANDAQIQIISIEDRSVKLVADSVPLLNHPGFTNDNKGIVYRSNKSNTKAKTLELLVYQAIEGHQKKIVLSTKMANQIAQSITQTKQSPDGEYVVFSYNDNLYLVPLINKRIVETNSIDTLPEILIRFARGGMSPCWEEGGRTLGWVEANKYCRITPDKIIKAAEGKAPNKSHTGLPTSNVIEVDIPVETLQVNLKAPSLYGKGIIVLTNARIITMGHTNVIENGTMLIKNGRFTYVGDSKKAIIPKEAKVIDLKGKSIIPGLIDMHNHMYINGDVPPGIISQQSWKPLINLAYGLTTIRDPFDRSNLFASSELINAGQMIGPRAYSAVNPIQPRYKLTSIEEAKIIVSNQKKMGAGFIKQYILGTRLERQLLLLACKEAGVNMTNEEEPNPLYWLAMIKDGSTCIEHMPLFGEVYNDFFTLVAKSGTYLTPTLQTGESNCKEYFHKLYGQSFLNENAALLPSDMKNYLKKEINDSKLDTGFLYKTRIIASINKAGGKIMMGSHGRFGFIAHYEIWALQMGGLTNYEALKTATSTAAEGLGVQKDLGSIEVGKIADLIILDKNPLEDIRNTISIKYVMKAGVLYESKTLEQVWPEKKKTP